MFLVKSLCLQKCFISVELESELFDTKSMGPFVITREVSQAELGQEVMAKVRLMSSTSVDKDPSQRGDIETRVCLPGIATFGFFSLSLFFNCMKENPQHCCPNHFCKLTYSLAVLRL